MSELSRREPLDTTAEIETPEHVRFRYHVAGPARRFFSYLIDTIVGAVIVIVLALVLAFAGFMSSEDLGHASEGILYLVAFIIQWFYYVVCEVAWSGRSPGKRALQLRVIGQDGHPLRIGQSILRNLLRPADFLPSMYAIGVLVMGNDRRFRRLGDVVAGTMVVVEKRHAVEGPVRIDPPPMPQELASLPQRLPLDGDDLEAIELLLRREYRISPARAYELASMIAPIFGARLNLRVHDPLRFLKILYARARGIAGVEPAPAFAQAPGQWPQAPWPQASWPAAPGYQGQGAWGQQGYGQQGYGQQGQAHGGFAPQAQWGHPAQQGSGQPQQPAFQAHGAPLPAVDGSGEERQRRQRRHR